jgi:predicted Rossmann fold flavoprotein
LPGGGFELRLENGELLKCDVLMLATGGCRTAAGGSLATALGHSLEPPVPSLFTFHVAEPWIRALAGISVPLAEVSVAQEGIRDRGPLLLTHAGLSGPAVLKLSAWGARQLHQLDYRFPLLIDWLPGLDADALSKKLEHCRVSQAARLIINSALSPLASRLWEGLLLAAGVARDTRWSALSNAARHRLVQQLKNTELRVTGKTLNQEEFVTCGGVKLIEVNFKTMESRLSPGLFFGGELLDIDGLTGGFNFQSAWTTGWIAGQAMAGR